MKSLNTKRQTNINRKISINEYETLACFIVFFSLFRIKYNEKIIFFWFSWFHLWFRIIIAILPCVCVCVCDAISTAIIMIIMIIIIMASISGKKQWKIYIFFIFDKLTCVCVCGLVEWLNFFFAHNFTKIILWRKKNSVMKYTHTHNEKYFTE